MRFPIGIQTFEKIIDYQTIYVDKTKYLSELISSGQMFFYARPRRFGKSLTVSTLKCIFNGQGELFKGLYIEDKWNFDIKYPIIRIDFSGLSEYDDGLEIALQDKLLSIAKNYKVELIQSKPKKMLTDLIHLLHQTYQQKVVILIDEYDKPLLDYIEFAKKERAEFNRTILQQFYSVIKTNEDKIQFMFITGITRFSKMSLFSALNNLKDISYTFPYTQLTGYTEEELLYYFKTDIETMRTDNFPELSYDELVKKIRKWYNGYNFGEGEKVYNPWSVLNCIQDKRFRNYWIDSGAPAFLFKLMKEKNQYIFNKEKDYLKLSDNFEIENVKLTTLLFQAGYITLHKKIDEDTFTFEYPNKEVEKSMVESILEIYFQYSISDTKIPIIAIKKHILQNNLKEVFKTFQLMINTIPSILLEKQDEKMYQVLFHSVITLVGEDIQSEIHFAVGTLDAVLQTDTHIYIIEFKINKDTSTALKQIKQKEYFSPYLLQSAKTIVLIGLNVDTATRTLQNKMRKLAIKINSPIS